VCHIHEWKAEVGIARGASAAKRLSKATLGMKANSATWKASFKAPRETPAADEARRALGRVLGSPIFRDSLRLASFLKFVVEAALDGKSDRIKSYPSPSRRSDADRPSIPRLIRLCGSKPGDCGRRWRAIMRPPVATIGS
jgi:hypothetical protein